MKVKTGEYSSVINIIKEKLMSFVTGPILFPICMEVTIIGLIYVILGEFSDIEVFAKRGLGTGALR